MTGHSCAAWQRASSSWIAANSFHFRGILMLTYGRKTSCWISKDVLMQDSINSSPRKKPGFGAVSKHGELATKEGSEHCKSCGVKRRVGSKLRKKRASGLIRAPFPGGLSSMSGA